MGPVAIDVDRLKAGEDYLKALRLLGLEPEALFWMQDLVEDRLVLGLVSRFVDIVGPTALSRLLFKAYNAAATPREIDPFIVRLHSPDHNMIRTMIDALDSFKTQMVDTGITKPGEMETAVFGNASVAIPLGHVYVWKDIRRPREDLLRKWGVISQRVDDLAAA